MAPVNDKIVIYKTTDGQTVIDVKLENETVWLSANQMSQLFDRDAKTIRKHINNVFSEMELDKESNTQKMRIPFSDKPVPFYTLDVIISVGYRVKSQRGTQFRIWANKVLKDYLVKGYAVNNKIAAERYNELKQLVHMIGRTALQQENLSSDEATALISVVSDYTYALEFDGKDLYPSVEEKAAVLLYLVTKNHSFSDGNKRIAATLFLWFMNNNGFCIVPMELRELPIIRLWRLR